MPRDHSAQPPGSHVPDTNASFVHADRGQHSSIRREGHRYNETPRPVQDKPCAPRFYVPQVTRPTVRLLARSQISAIRRKSQTQNGPPTPENQLLASFGSIPDHNFTTVGARCRQASPI